MQKVVLNAGMYSLKRLSEVIWKTDHIQYNHFRNIDLWRSRKKSEFRFLCIV